MSYSSTILKVMIASPSDVIQERTIVREVLYEWNTLHSEKQKIVLLPISWETHSHPEMGSHPQTIINKQILQDCDILIGVFWTRIGTSTEQYQSGTVEEIEEHIKNDKSAMLYFSNAPVHPDSVDTEQYSQLKEFRKTCEKRGLYETYDDINSFKEKFFHQLQLHLNSDKYIDISENMNEVSTKSSLPNLPSLSQEAEVLLKEGSKDANGTIVYLKSLSGIQIQTHGKSFINSGDPRYIAKWKSAIQELIDEVYIRDIGNKNEIYEVTDRGYKIAELL